MTAHLLDRLRGIEAVVRRKTLYRIGFGHSFSPVDGLARVNREGCVKVDVTLGT